MNYLLYKLLFILNLFKAIDTFRFFPTPQLYWDTNDIYYCISFRWTIWFDTHTYIMRYLSLFSLRLKTDKMKSAHIFSIAQWVLHMHMHPHNHHPQEGEHFWRPGKLHYVPSSLSKDDHYSIFYHNRLVCPGLTVLNFQSGVFPKTLLLGSSLTPINVL